MQTAFSIDPDESGNDFEKLKTTLGIERSLKNERRHRLSVNSPKRSVSASPRRKSSYY